MAASQASAGVPHVVQPGESLWSIAAANNFTTRALAAANGLSEGSPVVLGSTINIPSISEASSALQSAGIVPSSGSAPTSSAATPTSSSGGYTVQPGDTLSGIAAANGVSLSALAAANGVSPSSFAIAGTTIRIPSASSGASSSSASAPASAGTAAPGGSYAVQPGDTLSAIAAAHGVSLSALAAANGVSPDSFAIAGTTIQIPSASATPVPASTTSSEGPPALGGYTVRPGDTLSGIAAQAGVSMQQLAWMNGLSPKNFLLEGTVLKLPSGASAPAGAAAPAPAQTVVPAAAPNPTPERVTSAEIAQIAAEHGVPASLANAIAWQESGFNNSMVSSANARGVMQIMPGTWDWVNHSLTPSNPLSPNSALDNVRGGVLYLRQLLNDFGGDTNAAAAAYYQGEGAVKSHGLYPETQQYVNSVNALRARFGG
ncbi:MAG TPA: LysM peptidoglycan-binding domain-containing protein [Candidatus Limnocylindria bacterium]